MNTINKILVVVDASEDFASDEIPIEIRKALRLVAEKDKTEIRLASVGYERYLSQGFRSIGYDFTELREQYCDELRLKLEALAAGLKQEGYRVDCEVGWAHPRWELVLDLAGAFGADLIVQHTRRHAALEYSALSHDSWELVRHASIPVLLVKDQEWRDSVVTMAAVDPLHSHNKALQLDQAILDAALAVSAQLAGECHVVHAYAESARPFAPAGKIKGEHEAAFNTLMADYEIAADHQHLIDETPVFALQEFSAKLGSDLIVMGVVSRSRLHEALVGSTAEQVLDYVKTDVLAVKPAATA